MERTSESEVAIRDVDDPLSWDRAIEAAGPARLLALIDADLDAGLRRHCNAEDVWQETLLVAWRRRATFSWQGLGPFRRWLLEIARHCASDLRSGMRTQKRGGGRIGLGLSGSDTDVLLAGGAILGSTSPSRIAAHKEQAVVMRAALEALDPQLRDVVRLRLFEELSCESVAAQLGLGLSAVKHRARRGTVEYERRLRRLLRPSESDPAPRGGA